MNDISIDGIFQLLDFSLSHKILLLRKNDFKEEKNVNTDIFFSSTFYLEIPTTFDNILISQGNTDDCNYVRNRCSDEYAGPIRNENVFILTSNSKKYYIGARAIEMTQNNYDSNETSIGLKRI